ENSTLAPVNPYGRTKLMVEKLLPDYAKAHGLRFVSLRYFNAAGADPETETGEWHDPETHLIPLALDAALGRREKLEIFGRDYPTADGTCVRDYIHVCDIAQAHLLAADYLAKGGANVCLNMGNGQGFSVLQVLESAKRITGIKIPVSFGPRRPGDPPSLISSSKRCRATLGWKPRYTELDEIVSTAWTWHKKLHEQ
ncbi:MAG: UDP-glucose 4-epimerase GalE, partial [Elusimicrobia bacterium]|nr:UDP-glucose 4-epimerase GalE [Elusimicrobiota bacterium]